MSDDEPFNGSDDTADTGGTTATRGRMAPIIALVIALVCAGLFFVLAGAKNDDSESADTPLMGRPAPESIGELDGERFDLAHRKGSWVVLNFFDANCIPCRNEHPQLAAFYEAQESLEGQGAELITIVYGDDPEGVSDFFDANGGGWPVVFDDDGSISAAFGVNQVPETWVLDPDGIVRQRVIGEVTIVGLTQQVNALRVARGR